MKTLCIAFFVGLVCSLGAATVAVVGAETIKTVSAPPPIRENRSYAANRSPLQANPLIKLPVGAIKPRGWLRSQLELEADGLTGHLYDLSWYCAREGNPWVEPDLTGPEIYYDGGSTCYVRKGWEKEPYWLRGFGNLGYLLEDRRIIEETRKWVEGVLNSQQEDGWFGPVVNKIENDAWPNMVMLQVLRSYYEFSGDQRVIELMTHYYEWELNNPNLYRTGWWEKFRGGNDIEHIFWLYNRTGESWLLDLVHKIHKRIISRDSPHYRLFHGPNFAMGFREPAQYYMLTHEQQLLRATQEDYREVMGLFGQVPGGMFGADESARKGHDDPRQAAETCAMVEYMHSFELLLEMLGDPVWADRCEDVAFNSLPASMSPDLRMLHYLTAPNMVQLDKGNKSPGLRNHGCHLAYDANRWGAEYHCCTHNVGMGWPSYCEHLWMATSDSGLAAVMYAPCEVSATVGHGVEVSITETTDYPFNNRIELSLTTPQPVRFPLYLRVPGWCDEAQALVNGKTVDVETKPQSYVLIDRTWANADSVKLVLPMKIKLRKWTRNKNSVSVDRGPLTYSLKIEEDWKRFGGTEEWPAYEVYPASPWNYGLVFDEDNPESSFEVVDSSGGVPRQPFGVDSAPVVIRAKARRIPEWKLDNLNLVGELQQSPAHSAEPTETVHLIPMGAARLRISSFPTIAIGGKTHQWVVTEPFPLASNYSLRHGVKPLFDGEIPQGSGDGSKGVFAWPASHQGTTEWVQYGYNEPKRIGSVKVYWYDNSQGNRHDESPEEQYRVPHSWKLLYEDGGTWKPVTGVSNYGTDLNRFNNAVFDVVTTKALRLEVELQTGFSAGIIEWSVND